jgi:asparagine synthase (glutamine-hydrolysing)
MCGIIGYWGNEKINPEIFARQAKTLHRRGPDNLGIWSDQDNHFTLGHLRLSILDLSNNGNQPMQSASSRYVISYNGEIYNFLDLKKELLSVKPELQFNSSSDTEILLQCIEIFGLNNALKKCKGMFALALWDKRDKTLSLARDRLGEKPLYFYQNSKKIFFASELKAFSFLQPDLKISKKGVDLFLSQGNIPAPYSIYENIFKIKPSEIITFSSPGKYHSCLYWDIDSFEINENISEHEVNSRFEELFLQSVSSQMVSDVPLGAFLSGGLDSSAVVSAMVECSPDKINTYSIGFEEELYNEAQTAKVVAEHLNTDHHELFVTEKDAIDLIPDMPTVFCEPFGDSSQLPTFLLCKETKKDITVCLSGDGGDEIFGGYRRYIDIHRFQKIIHSSPLILRKQIASFIHHLLRSRFKGTYERLFKNILNLSHPSEQLYKISNVLLAEDLRDIFYKLSLQWNHDGLIKGKSRNIDASVELDNIFQTSFNSVMSIRNRDIKNYLPNDILVKVDRSAMFNSLETRIPFLDIDLVEFALTIPFNRLIKGARGKLPVRSFLETRIPAEVFDKPKSGFGAPIEFWLKNELRPWAEELLFGSNATDLIGMDPQLIKSQWQNFLTHNHPLHHDFWNILMLKAWADKNNLYF